MVFEVSILTYVLGMLTALVVTTYAYFKWIYQYWKSRGVPFLEPVIPYGNFENPRRRTVSLGQRIANLYKEARAKGWKHCGIYFFSKPFYLVLELDILKLILTKDFQHFVDRGMYVNEKDDPISAHLFAVGGAKWRKLRTKLTPTFTSGKMKTMFQTLVDCTVTLEDHIKEQINNKEGVDIRKILGNYSMDVIGSCAFGLDCNSFKDVNSPFRVHCLKALETTNNDGLFKTLLKETFPNFARLLKVREFTKDVGDFFIQIVNKIVTLREETNTTRKDLMQLLIELKNKGEKGDENAFTMNEIVAQSFVFFVAGFETTSSTMSFAMYELARHPEIQDRVRAEIEEVLGRHNNQITYDVINEMKYMRQVIDETLRKYPPVPFITRVCGEDYKMPGDDIVIEKGTSVMIPIYGIHYNEKYYENPQVFDPQRFSEENRKKLPQYAHIPFGEGPRICVGERFAIMETKVGLSTVLRKFRLSLNKKTDVPLRISPETFIITITNGIWLDMEPL